jgi:hypothetical protein
MPGVIMVGRNWTIPCNCGPQTGKIDAMDGPQRYKTSLFDEIDGIINTLKSQIGICSKSS